MNTLTRPLHNWRLPPVLPTIPSPISSTLFWPPSNNPHNKFSLPGLQTYSPAETPCPFHIRLRPIKPLVTPSAPPCHGSLILRSFLYARKYWPDQPFRNVAAQALEAVNESYRVDGLPRVVFVVSTEVEKPLRGKMSSVLRHRFKRRMKTAFRMALEEKRKEDKGSSQENGHKREPERALKNNSQNPATFILLPSLHLLLVTFNLSSQLSHLSSQLLNSYSQYPFPSIFSHFTS